MEGSFEERKEAVRKACKQNEVYHGGGKYPRVKVVSALEAPINVQLRKFFGFLLWRAKFKFQQLDSPRIGHGLGIALGTNTGTGGIEHEVGTVTSEIGHELDTGTGGVGMGALGTG
jgi:hypothetical protein